MAYRATIGPYVLLSYEWPTNINIIAPCGYHETEDKVQCEDPFLCVRE